MNLSNKQLETIKDAYVTALLWSSTDEFGEPLDGRVASIDLHERAACDVKQFISSLDPEKLQEHLTVQSEEQLGHDLCLTRNRHGAGFWDRGLGALGEYMTDKARKMGEVWPYVGDDGCVYV